MSLKCFQNRIETLFQALIYISLISKNPTSGLLSMLCSDMVELLLGYML